MFRDEAHGGYTLRVYSCPNADPSLEWSARHHAALDDGRYRLLLDEHGRPFCTRCLAPLWPDNQRKSSFSREFVIVEAIL